MSLTTTLPAMAADTAVLAALSSGERSLWYMGLGIGLVVVLVVIALLSLLLKIVIDIDEGVAGVWKSAKRLAANTATSWQVRETAQTLRALRREAQAHNSMLEERL